MSSEHIETRQKIKDIARVDVFRELLDSCTLSDIDKQILCMHYLEERDYAYIGDVLGFSESGIKKRHRKALKKISRVL